MSVPKPLQGDYQPYWDDYFRLLPEGDATLLLQEQLKEVVSLYVSFGEEKSLYRYADGKWSLKEVLGHLIDTERTSSYRLMCIARGDKVPLPRHPEHFVNGTRFDRRPLIDLVEEFRAVRASTLALAKGLTAEEWRRAGIINDTRTTAAAIGYFIAAHTCHHLDVVRERYMGG
ncbi:DinB family protein [Cohnella lubricantis]|uniref:DinB family protein n=1 Tax=Cohnella lubricantis TaxID=2163172 RepID=A0A841T6T9_9BACL|nr:DinB family protein [Cohnella lubricantis]MBB6676602.1 DinB family protein [Cohnella lubricantis]MBP2117387.1 hypothetical protein [Cohnella lubricantis]